MVQPAVSDPTAALLAFSKSFKKVRRARTITPKQYVNKRTIPDQSIRQHTKIRSTSLPNPDDLYIVVRDNDRRLSGQKFSTLKEMKMRKIGSRMCQSGLLFTTTTDDSSSVISNNTNHSAKEYFESYLKRNGSLKIAKQNGTHDKTTKSLRPKLILIKLSAMKQSRKVS